MFAATARDANSDDDVRSAKRGGERESEKRRAKSKEPRRAEARPKAINVKMI